MGSRRSDAERPIVDVSLDEQVLGSTVCRARNELDKLLLHEGP
jgi:hypothetical protein